MGALKDIGIDPEGSSFKSAYERQVKESLKSGLKITIPGLNITLGFDTPNLPELQREKVSDAFEKSIGEENNKFSNLFSEQILGGLVNVIDIIPPINVLSAVAITDPTAPILPIINEIVEIIGQFGIDSPYTFILENIDKIMSKKEEFEKAFEEIATQSFQMAALMLSETLASIDQRLDAKILFDKIYEILPNFQLPEPPNIDEAIAGFTSTIANLIPNPILDLEGLIPDLPNIELPDVSSLLNLLTSLEPMPSIGAVFLETLKKILETALEVVGVNILSPPPFLTSIIGKLQQLPPPSLLEIIGAAIEGVANNIFEKINQTDISKIIESGVTFVAAFNAMILIIIKSIVVSLIGVLMGKGLLMQSAAISLGLLV
jgi:hypothetical protein